MGEELRTVGDHLIDLVVRALIRVALLLPYRWRIPAAGWLARRVIAPIAGFGPRIRANLAHVLPDLPKADIRRIVAEVADNVGRSFIEFYSPDGFKARLADAPLSGPGVAALLAAHAAGRPALLVGGHFGNYTGVAARLVARGIPVAALYRPMNNRLFNAHYARATAEFCEPLFARDRRGMADMLRHTRAGGITGVLIDQFYGKGAPVTFFGQTAPTATAIAEMALKFDAALIPAYAIRQPDGLGFDVVLEAPIPHADPVTMTQACNDSLEARVRAHMGQWLWTHRRWKPERQRRRAAASIAPGPSA